MIRSDEDRFWKYAIPLTDQGCWGWIGSVDHDGYGRFRLKGKTRKAHRVAYQLMVGPIRNGLCACHRCDTPSCVNPDHIFLGTVLDNNRDCAKKGRKAELKRTQCPRGHVYSGRWKTGERICRTCRNERYRKWWTQNADKINAARRANHADALIKELGEK